MLSALERGVWSEVEPLFHKERPLEAFPLKLALEQGAQWEGVKRGRVMDQHAVMDVDLTYPTPCTGGLTEACGRQRFTFWLKLEQPALPFDDFFAEVEGEERPKELVEVAGWRAPQLVPSPSSQALIPLDDINTPARFSATSFRGVPDLRAVGVFGEGELDLKGWSASLVKLEPQLTPLKKRGCKRVQLRVSKPLLERDLNRCAELLAREAQRAHNTGAETIRGDVALHDAGRDSFAGALTLRQDLSLEPRLRLAPELTEAMLLAQDFTSCVQERVQQWSRDHVAQAQCELTLSMLFKVEIPESARKAVEPDPELQFELESLTQPTEVSP